MATCPGPCPGPSSGPELLAPKAALSNFMTYGAFRMALAKQMVMKNHKNENYSDWAKDEDVVVDSV